MGTLQKLLCFLHTASYKYYNLTLTHTHTLTLTENLMHFYNVIKMNLPYLYTVLQMRMSPKEGFERFCHISLTFCTN